MALNIGKHLPKYLAYRCHVGVTNHVENLAVQRSKFLSTSSVAASRAGDEDSARSYASITECSLRGVSLLRDPKFNNVIKSLILKKMYGFCLLVPRNKD